MSANPVELLSPEEMGRADRETIARGIPGIALMEHAGRAVARSIVQRFKPCRVLVLAGPGNNGGDGYATARRLIEMGWSVAVASIAAPRSGSDAAQVAAHFRGPRAPFLPERAAHADLVIDALFGAGLNRSLDERARTVLEAAPRIVAVDVPSGLDGASGRVRGYAPRATLTVTFFRCKPGHILLPGRLLVGELKLADIGIPSEVLRVIRPRTFINDPQLWRLPVPGLASHKYTRGHVTILGGAEMTGAARLVAAAARRVGAGMVTIAAPAKAAAIYRCGAPGVIVSEASLDHLLADVRRNVWVCGPGLGPDAAGALLPELLRAGRKVVVDADALTACAGRPEMLCGAAVLTPHAGEFERVFGSASDRLAATRAAAAASGAVVVLKGADSVIAAPDGWAAINTSAPPALATAGAGDVLSGLIAGLLAQGMQPRGAAAAGVFLHGEAARHAGFGLIAEDVPDAIPHAMLATLRASASSGGRQGSEVGDARLLAPFRSRVR